MASPAPLRIAISIAVAVATAPATVRAQPVDSTLGEARDLFLKAEADEDAGHWTDALDKLKRVSGIRFTAGIRYHLALCEEHLDKLASARADFLAADSQARASGAQDVAELAGPRLAAIGPNVPRLQLAGAVEEPGAVAILDGAVIDRPRAILELDAGTHQIDVSVPGRTPVSVSVTVKDGELTVLHVPLGAPTEIQAAAASPTPGTAEETRVEKSATRPSADRTLPIVATGATVVLAGLGASAFILAGMEHSSGRSSCATMTSCDGAIATVRAWDWAALAAWTAAAGGAVVSVLLWSHPSHDVTGERGARSARLLVGPSSVAVAGSF